MKRNIWWEEFGNNFGYSTNPCIRILVFWASEYWLQKDCGSFCAWRRRQDFEERRRDGYIHPVCPGNRFWPNKVETTEGHGRHWKTSCQLCWSYVFDTICCLSDSQDGVPKQSWLLPRCHGSFAQEMKDLLENGITDAATGEVWRFVVVGVKGDMPYLQKIGKLKRSWNTTVKRGNARTAPRGVCHLCLAGTQDLPCEDTSDNACWIPTVGVQVPWDSMPGILRYLPHDRSHPGSFLQPDLWHCIHLGIGKAFLASTLQVALETVPASNNEERFQWLTNHYHQWCRSVKRSSYVAKITAYLVSYGDGPGATGNWSKGSLTTNLARWLEVLLNDLGGDQEGLLTICGEAIKQLNNALSFLYNAPLFLERLECEYVCSRGMYFVQTYTALASKCFALNRSHLYPLFPKLHAVHHIFLTLHQQATNHGYGANPLAASCQLDETR